MALHAIDLILIQTCVWNWRVSSTMIYFNHQSVVILTIGSLNLTFKMNFFMHI
jgi:hypothetical protein